MKLDILAFGAHPDDVEISASGTLINHIKKGDKCGIIDLTRGELGTRGSAEQRNEEAKVGLNTLMVSAADGDLGRVKELMMSGSDVNSRSESGYTALMYAVRNDHIDIVQFLLSSGADAGAASAKGTTAIAIAKKVGNPKMVECLLQHCTQ